MSFPGFFFQIHKFTRNYFHAQRTNYGVLQRLRPAPKMVKSTLTYKLKQDHAASSATVRYPQALRLRPFCERAFVPAHEALLVPPIAKIMSEDLG